MAAGTARRRTAHRKTVVFGIFRPGGILPKTPSSALDQLFTRKASTIAKTGVRFM
jgi:hypothetical protein